MPEIGGPPVQQNRLFGLRPIRSWLVSPTILFGSATTSIREQSKPLSLSAAFSLLGASGALRYPGLDDFPGLFVFPGETAPPGITPPPGLGPPPGVNPPAGAKPPGLTPPLEPVPAPVGPELPPVSKPKPCSRTLFSCIWRAKFVDMPESGSSSETSVLYAVENELKGFVRLGGSGKDSDSGGLSIFVEDGTELSELKSVLAAVIDEPSN